MARAKQPARGTPKDEASVKVEEEAVVPAQAEEAIGAESRTTDETGAALAIEAAVGAQDIAPAVTEAPAAEEAPVPAPVEVVAAAAPVIETAEIQPIALAATGTTTSYQTIVAEVTDYSRRSVENGSAFVKKLLGAKSLESAILIQSEYAKTSYVDFVTHLTRIGALYSKLATEIIERRSRVA